MPFDAYKVPGAVVQSFDANALHAFHLGWQQRVEQQQRQQQQQQSQEEEEEESGTNTTPAPTTINGTETPAAATSNNNNNDNNNMNMNMNNIPNRCTCCWLTSTRAGRIRSGSK